MRLSRPYRRGYSPSLRLLAALVYWLAALGLLLAPAARAGNADGDLTWPAQDKRVGVPEGILIGGLSVGALLAQFLPQPSSPNWTGGILFDDAIRSAFRASSPQAQSNAGTASNFGFIGLAAYPVAIDAILVAGLGKGKADVATQLALIDVEALAVDGLLTTAIQRTVARARPFTRDCATNPQPDCTEADRNTSFLSGHSSMAFTGAVTLCVQHSRLPLYGSGDAAVCPIALVVAAATGVLRIVADRHYATDVLAGAALGSAVGYLVSSAHLREDASAGAISPQPGGRVAYTFYF